MRLHDLIHRRADDGGGSGRVPLAEVDDSALGGSGLDDLAPGTGLEPEDTSPPDPAAEPSDTEPGGGPPQAIPYSRFQEVNNRRKAVEDAYRPYAELSSQGYEAEDLHRLVQWELEFTQDPATTWLATAETIMDRLPDPVREAIQAIKGQTPEPTGQKPDGGTPPPTGDDEGVPEWFKPYAEDLETRKEREREEEEAKVAAEAQRANSELLDRMIQAWGQMDEREKVATSDSTKLTYIIAASQRDDDPVKVLTAAREAYLEEREGILKGAIRPGGSGGPRPVPSGGSGGTPRNTPPPARTIGEASKRAMAAIRDGALPLEEG